MCASSASVLAGSSTLLSTGHTGLSDLAHGLAIGLVCATSIGLSAISFVFLKRERGACSRTESPGI